MEEILKNTRFSDYLHSQALESIQIVISKMKNIYLITLETRGQKGVESFYYFRFCNGYKLYEV